MIGKLKKGSSFGGCIRYVTGKDEAKILASDGVLLGTNAEIVQSFELQRQLNPRIKKPVGHIALRFNYTFCPDEFFLQTLVWNQPAFRAALYSEKDEYEGCMRLIDWKRGNPYVWTLADKEELKQSNRLFARKFDMKHEDIIHWIKTSFG